MDSLATSFQIVASNNVDFRARLVAKIDDLILYDFNRLVQVLYQVDVDEARLRMLLREKTSTNASEILADLLIEREEKKMASRKRENNAHEDIPEDEKW